MGLRAAPAVLALLLACVAGAAGAAEDGAGEQLQQLERALEEGLGRQRNLEHKASELKREVKALRGALIAAAASAQRHEEAVSGLERRLSELTAEAEAKNADLVRRRAELAATLGALQRLARLPPEALIASPASAVDTVRSSILLSAVVPELEARAETLRRDLARLDDLYDEITARKAELAAADAGLVKERRTLDALLERKAALQVRTEAKSARERQRLARLAEQAENLRALMAGLEAEREAREEIVPGAKAAAPRAPATAPRIAALAPPREITRPFSAARGTLALPARGRIIGRFGQRKGFDTPSRGITIETRPAAQVVAPYDGRIVFAGPFRGYGQLLIIEHGEGYHTLIAGLSRTDGIVGQWLLAGEPIGQMGEEGGRRPTLYVELRRNGEPINPMPWLAASERKTSG